MRYIKGTAVRCPYCGLGVAIEFDDVEDNCTGNEDHIECCYCEMVFAIDSEIRVIVKNVRKEIKL